MAEATLKMTFNLDNGKTKLYNLASPKADISAEEVSAAMGTMISKAAAVVGGAALESAKGAVIRNVEETVLF